MKWISVKDRLPEKRGRYFVLMTFRLPVIVNETIRRKNIPTCGTYSPESGWLSKSEAEDDITHWMEIPPYEGI